MSVHAYKGFVCVEGSKGHGQQLLCRGNFEVPIFLSRTLLTIAHLERISKPRSGRIFVANSLFLFLFLFFCHHSIYCAIKMSKLSFNYRYILRVNDKIVVMV